MGHVFIVIGWSGTNQWAGIIQIIKVYNFIGLNNNNKKTNMWSPFQWMQGLKRLINNGEFEYFPITPCLNLFDSAPTSTFFYFSNEWHVIHFVVTFNMSMRVAFLCSLACRLTDKSFHWQKTWDCFHKC